MIEDAISELTPIIGTVPRRWRPWGRTGPAGIEPTPQPRTTALGTCATPQPRALSDVERKEIKATLESDEFVDEAPATVYAKLLDQGTYLASVSTMYRVLHEYDEVRVSAAARPPTRRTRNPSSSPRDRISVGRGTSPNCTVPKSGRITTY